MTFSDWLKENNTYRAGTSTSPAPTKVSQHSITSGTSVSKPTFSQWLQQGGMERKAKPATASMKLQTGTTETAKPTFSQWLKTGGTAKNWAKESVKLLDEIQSYYSSWHKTDNITSRNFQSRASNLISASDEWLKQYDGNQEATSYISSVVSALDNVGTYTAEMQDFYSTFTPTEEQAEQGVTAESLYNSWYTDYSYRQKYIGKTYSELNDILTSLPDGEEKDWLTSYAPTVMDLTDHDTKIAYLEIELSEMQALLDEKEHWHLRNMEKEAAASRKIAQSYGSEDNLIDALSQKKAEKLAAEQARALYKLTAVADPNSEFYDPDFEKKAVYVSTATPDGWGGDLDTGYTDIVYEFINGNEDISELVVGMHNNYYYIREDEKRLYNYYHYLDRENGTDLAQQYLDSIRAVLNDRASEEAFQEYKGKIIPELMYGAKAGISSFANDVNNWFLQEDDYIPPTATELTSQRIREDLSDVSISWYNMRTGEWNDKILGRSLGQIGYDAITGVSRMTPSVLASSLVSMVSPAAGMYVGNAMLGASSAGSAYREKLNLGYSPEEAKTYGTLIGASEAAMNTLLGGIGALGGKAMNVALKNLDKVDDIFARFAKSPGGKYVLSIASEGGEESLQSFLEPYLWSAVSGEPVSQDWEENLYNGLQGMISAVFFEGSSLITGLSPETDAFSAFDTRDSVNFSFGATKEIIDAYVEAAYSNQNTVAYKKYAAVSEQLLSDVAEEIDLTGYAHALRDNDIRHIRNSHGEKTNEKYPVTKEDIKNIPWLVQNYDKVLTVKRNDGKTGIVYVKAMPNGLVYYLEQVTSVYGNEPLLINKQMIKTGLRDIPDIKGLRAAITKKQSETEFLNDLEKVPQVYAQSVRQFHSIDSIRDSPGNVKLAPQAPSADMINTSQPGQATSLGSALTHQEVLERALHSVKVQDLNPRIRKDVRSYETHLQQKKTIESLLQTQESKLKNQQSRGASAYEQQRTANSIAKLNKLLSREEQQLQILGNKPSLQQFLKNARSQLSALDLQEVENLREIDVENNQTYVRINTDSGAKSLTADALAEQADSKTKDDLKAQAVREKRARTAEQNRLAGKLFEDTRFEDYKAISINLEKQITIKVGSRKVRVDAIGYILNEDGSYSLQILEFKSSETAPLTRNQTDLFPLLAEKGGVVAGKGKGFFHGGKIIPPGTVIKIIRGTTGGNWYVSDRFG